MEVNARRFELANCTYWVFISLTAIWRIHRVRSKELKINNETKEAILVAGGSGFKVYAVSGLGGWAVALGRKISFIEDKTPEFQTVANYVNLKYQPANSLESIKQEFSALIEAINKKEKAPNSEPSL